MRITFRPFAPPRTLGLQSGQLGFRQRDTPRGPRAPRAFLPDSIPGTVKRRRKLFESLCSRLIIHGAIRTTYPRCKGIARGFYRYIRWAKRNTPQARRRARSHLPDGRLPLRILFSELGPRFKDHKGSCVKVFKTGFRPRDAAPMGIIQIKGSPRDLEYHLATMTVGRQLAIHIQGHDTLAAQEQASTWRAAPLREPVLPCNGHDLHPSYRYLPRSTQLLMLRLLDGRTAEACREFDQLARYHYDRTLAIARLPASAVADELSRQEDDSAQVAVYDDAEPLIEGEAGFEAQEAARLEDARAAIAAGRLPQGTPTSQDDVAAQRVPPEGTTASLGARRTTPRWARSPLQLARGQRAKPGHLQRLPRWSGLASEQPDRWRTIWKAGVEREEAARIAAMEAGGQRTR